MNMLSGNQINPYAPAWPTTERESASSSTTALGVPATPSLGRLILRWTVVRSIAAAPSFFLGYDVSKQQTTAMSLGVLIFIAFYVMADLYTRRWPWRQSIIVRRILVFCYGTRITISICFPIGMMVDMFAGLVSVTIVAGPSDDAGIIRSMSFVTTLTTTLVQGFVLNLVLAVWGLLAFVIVLAFKFTRDRLMRRIVEMLRNAGRF